MKMSRFILCSALFVSVGALLFSKAWSAPISNNSSVPLPTVPTVIIPQTFTVPMELSLRVKASADEYDEEPILWIDERADTSKVQQYAIVSLFARPNDKPFGTQKTGNLKVRWHSTGGLFLAAPAQAPSQNLATTYSDINGQAQVSFGTRQPGKYTLYAEVLSPDGKVHATSDPIEIELKIAGDKVEVIYGSWLPVEGNDDLYSRKIWAYYIRDNEDIIQNINDNTSNTPLNLAVELYDGSPVSQKVSWLDKVQVNTPTNNDFKNFPNETDQPLATQFFRYNPVAAGPHDLDAYFVKGVKR